MEKRVLLAVFLSFLVLFVYQSLVVGPVPPEEPGPEIPAAQPPPPPVAGAVAPQPPASGQEEPGIPSEPEPEPLVADAQAREILVETEHVTAVFSSRGAELVSWELKDYADEQGDPLEFIPVGLAEDYPRPFSLAVDDAAITARLSEALFKPSADHLSVTEGSAPLVFEYRDTSGLGARKEFHFGQAPYVVGFNGSVEQNGQPVETTLQWGPGPSGVKAASGIGYRQGPQGIFFGRVYEDGVLQDLHVSRVASPARPAEIYEGQFVFAGIDNHYFLAAALLGGRQAQVRYQPVSVPLSGASSEADTAFVAYDLRFADAPTTNVAFFIGPKDFDILASVDPDLVRAINFGWLSWLVVPLHRSLKWVHGFVGNYGWSIIILTVLINAAMFPLRHKSVVSMRKMQELQPEMKAIQNRYANLKASDPGKQKMNTELMNLYRDRGVNPASGCLPMLLTMPVLFAFYRLLTAAIEIRGAPFVLWITDLAAHDPLYVTPLVMGVTMVLQQKMTPSTADATQQKIMMFMPIVFTFMFLWAPSGLVLYWLTSNLWGIGQQVLTNRIIGPPVVRTVRPPAERRVKKLGREKAEAVKEGA